MPNAHGFNRVKTTLSWQAARRSPVKPPTPEQFGWQLRDGQYHLPGVTDVHLERAKGLSGFTLVYQEPIYRMRISASLLGRLTELILEDNGCTANETPIKPT